MNPISIDVPSWHAPRLEPTRDGPLPRRILAIGATLGVGDALGGPAAKRAKL